MKTIGKSQQKNILLLFPLDFSQELPYFGKTTVNDNDMTKELSGVFPILVTPFDDTGRIDDESLRRLIDFCIESGVHGLGMFGLASEFYKLTPDERRLTLDTVIRQVDGRVPVVVGTGGPGGEVAAINSREAESEGGSRSSWNHPVVVYA